MRSSLFKCATYNEDTQTMTTYFHNDAVYQYRIPEEIYVRFFNADSLGKYYNYHIKGHYQYRKYDRSLRKYTRWTVTY